MREIRFRAWDREVGKMTEPFPLGCELAGDGFDVDWILMQYTGLKDKNGREIYEGDVVKWLGHEVRAGKQIRPERISTIGGKYGWITDCFFLQNIAEGNGTQEVIGNIYENPDLVAK